MAKKSKIIIDSSYFRLAKIIALIICFVAIVEIFYKPDNGLLTVGNWTYFLYVRLFINFVIISILLWYFFTLIIKRVKIDRFGYFFISFAIFFLLISIIDTKLASQDVMDGYYVYRGECSVKIDYESTDGTNHKYKYYLLTNNKSIATLNYDGYELATGEDFRAYENHNYLSKGPIILPCESMIELAYLKHQGVILSLKRVNN